MDTVKQNKANPLVNIAAVAVIIACLVAVAAATGAIPSAHSQKQGSVLQTGSGEVPGGLHSQGAFASGCPQQCGVIASIQSYEVKGQGTGIGAVAGGVTGAVVGSQFGHGTGRAALGVLGAAGGAFAGHEIEKNVRKTTHWRVSVRMDDGSMRIVRQSSQPAFAVGDKVRVGNGALTARG